MSDIFTLNRLYNISSDIYNTFKYHNKDDPNLKNEKHAITYNKDTKKYEVANYLGPFTNYEYRQNFLKSKPINDIDHAAMIHDGVYNKIQNELKNKTITKNEAIKEIHNADVQFINEAKMSNDDPKIGKISAKMISLKMNAEKKGILPTKIFSGVGKKRKNKSKKVPKFILKAIKNKI